MACRCCHRRSISDENLAGGLQGAEGGQCGTQPGGCRYGDLSLRLALVVGLDELLELLLDLLLALLGILARRAEQQLLSAI